MLADRDEDLLSYHGVYKQGLASLGAPVPEVTAAQFHQPGPYSCCLSEAPHAVKPHAAFKHTDLGLLTSSGRLS